MPLDAEGLADCVGGHDVGSYRGRANTALPQREINLQKILGRNAILGADLNYDFKTDFVFATLGRIRIYQQDNQRHFSRVTAKTKLPA